MRVVHLAAFHPATDVRVFDKECRALAEAGHEVTLLAPVRDRAPSGETGVQTRALDVPAEGSLVRRLRAAWRAASAALCDVEADVLHFHEAQMIPVVLRHRRRFRSLVYDVHENAPIDVAATLVNLGRPMLAKLAEQVYRHWEGRARRSCDRFVCAYEALVVKFPAEQTIMIRNYPRLSEFSPTDSQMPYAERPLRCVYAGNLTVTRGAAAMVEAMGQLTRHPDAALAIAGKILPPALESELASSSGWVRVERPGWLGRCELVELYESSRVGLVVLDALPDFEVALPIKLFEYMAAGMPVIASDFKLWRDIVEGAGCGMLVKPGDSRAIADAITWLFDHPLEAEAMGRRGRAAVERLYNWEAEQEKLVQLYEGLAAGRRDEPCA